jgi:hypothetical protein
MVNYETKEELMAGAGKHYWIALLVVTASLLMLHACRPAKDTVGVIYVIHGGMSVNKPLHLWDASVHQFSYDPNHSVYKLVIWNPANWPMVLDATTTDFAVRFMRMYAFEYARIGGTDPYQAISDQQLAGMKAALDEQGGQYGLTFEVDWAGYMAADRIDHYAYPRFIYHGPDGPDAGANCTYCGEGEPDGPWPDCDPERYNVDGPVERLLKKGATRIIMVDWTVGGPRFSKSYDVVEMTRRALDAWNEEYGTDIPLLWVNDYSDLMKRSYPAEPAGWTRTLGLPDADTPAMLNGSPNPVSSDPMVATLNTEAIEAAFSENVSDADTGVVIFNHALHDNNEVFDPKVDDTLIINESIKKLLLERHPDMDAAHIIGAYGGIQESNPENGLEERNRGMRGESYGHAWLYESAKVLPGDEWGYRYWDALEYLKNRGVKHIAIGFPQVTTDTALNLVEVFNQIGGREIGYKNWLKWGTFDYTTYPGVGHPFADYWGNWVNTDCGEWEMSYERGNSAFTPGRTITGSTSGATGVIKWVQGSITDGILTLKQVSGTFQDGELLSDSTDGSASAAGSAIMTSKPECCFEMGGCSDPLRPYPPPRQTPLNGKMSDLDPNLCFDISEYGHIGYDPAKGDPDPGRPVQDQYTGTWEMYRPPNADARVGQLLARHVLNAAINPLVYLSDGELKHIRAGESVTFQAHVVSGKPDYRYQWSSRKEGEDSWSAVGENGETWTWSTASGDEGTYVIRCRVTDANDRTGEVTWERFTVETP